MLQRKKLLLPSETKDLFEQITQTFSNSLSTWTSSESIRELTNAGFKFNSVSENIYDRVFLLPCDYEYTESNADQLRSFNFLESDASTTLKDQMKKIHWLIERVGQTLFTESHVPGYIFTTKSESERTRIPVHIHKGSSEKDRGDEVTLSVAMLIDKRSEEPTKFRLFQPEPSRLERTQEELIEKSNTYLDFEINNQVNPFVFQANLIPHTVLFSEDIILWAVFNGVRVRPEFKIQKTEVGFF